MEKDREVQAEFSIWISCSSCSEKSPQDVARRLLSAMERTSGCDTGQVLSESLNVQMQERARIVKFEMQKSSQQVYHHVIEIAQ